MTNEQKRDFARTLYLHDPDLTQHEISVRTGVKPHTVGEWIKKEGWDKLRRSRLATRQKSLANTYAQLEELEADIMRREEGKRIPNMVEAKIQLQLAAKIRQLETTLSAAEVMDVCMALINHVRTIAPDKAADFMDFCDSYLKTVLRR